MICGAATNRIMIAWSTLIKSMGIPCFCKTKPPLLRAPNSKAAKTVPTAVLRPKTATAIPSKPKPDEKPDIL